MLLLYRRTHANLADTIFKNGFTDHTGTYLTDHEWTRRNGK
jgi:hypothetical protein